MKRILHQYWIPVLIFAASIAVSFKTIDAPLNLRHDWLTAHSLVNLHYYQECSWISGYGASVMLPPRGEFDCQSVSRLTAGSRELYLSYPSLWLLQIQPLYQLARWILPGSIPDYQVLRILTLCLVRLPVLICSFFIFQLTFKRIARVRKRWQSNLMSAAGLLSLCGIPGFLHYTQNVYFSDMAVVAPVMLLAIFWAGDRPLQIRSRYRNFYLGLLSFFCAGLDWYGSLAVLVAFAISVQRDLICARRVGTRSVLAILFNRHSPIILGAIFAAAMYLAQLVASGAGIEMILDVARFRMAGNSEASKLDYLISFSANLVQGYLPQILLKKRVLPALLLILAGLTGTMVGLRRCNQMRTIILIVVLSPLIQLILLTQHSAIHDFSGLKFVPLLILFIFIAPAGLIMRYLSRRRFANLILGLLFLIIISGTFDAASKRLTRYSIYDMRSPHLENLAALAAILRDARLVFLSAEVPVHEPDEPDRRGDLVAEIFPPNQQALIQKRIYEPNNLHSYRSYMTQEALQNFKIALLAYQGTIERKQTTLQCPTNWVDTGVRLHHGPVMICKTQITVDSFINRNG